RGRGGGGERTGARALAREPPRGSSSAGARGAALGPGRPQEPILARPPSALYQLRKFARRHRALVAAGLGIGLVLAAGTVVSIMYAVRAGQNARVANENARHARYQSYRARLATPAAALSPPARP